MCFQDSQGGTQVTQVTALRKCRQAMLAGGFTCARDVPAGENYRVRMARKSVRKALLLDYAKGFVVVTVQFAIVLTVMAGVLVLVLVA